ncbi:FUSC family protein [Stakelama saccharophila]|uniref:FUSC family protein n=1 Tax=Stakelama saccharophila TaxID=3075605 RepID=A0ABZ0B9F1_9SPHN|nr:FUSC family protein [Stakelama sp. W311]WNO54035.1 FUSC family protein [Stakelama sp. W311]
MADRFGTDGALYGLKCWAGAMLAAYVALSIGLPRPYWAMITAYIVSQPQAGAVRSKAVFRVLGTALGAGATIVLVPNLANAPELLSLAMALWVGFCLYVSLLDRTPRSYVLLLAGYTAAIIGFPSVSQPGAIFTVASLRVQEITIGILSATLVHGLIFPRSVTAGLLARIDGFVADAERWSADALKGEASETLDRERRRLASDITDLHLMSTHLPFDTARLLPRVRTVRALQDRLSMLLPVASAVEDRLHLLLSSQGVPQSVGALLADVRGWLRDGAPPEQAGALAERANALEPAGSAEPGELLRLSLLARLAEMIALHRQVRLLREQLHSPDRRAVSPDVEALLSGRSRRPLHRDHGFALRSAGAAVGGILLCCTIWIGTAWPEGSVAAMMVAVFCSLFAALDDPTPAIRAFFLYTLMSLPLSAFYLFWVLPHVDGFALLAVALAPALLIFGRLMADPATTLPGLAMALGLLGSVALGERYAASFPTFLNGALAQLGGVAIAFVATRLLRTIGADWSARRLIRAGWHDVIAMAERRTDDVSAWTGRMLDRLGLLTPRLGALGEDDRHAATDMLVDLRVGLSVAELDTLSRRVASERGRALADALAEVRAHYLALLDGREPDHAGGLARIDAAIAAVGTMEEPAARRAGLIALTGIRRNLFPAAATPEWDAAA